ncbi:hypothetical protein Tco_0282846 [Tanacetum coccineum]
MLLPPLGPRISVGFRAFCITSIYADVERLLALPTPPLTSLSPPSAGERLARLTDPPVHPSPLLLPSSGCLTQTQALRTTSTQALIDAVTAALPSLFYHIICRRRRIDFRGSEMPPREEVPPCLFGYWDLGTRRELAELHEHDTQDLYALLEDAQDGRSRISQQVDKNSQRVDLLMGDRMTLQETVWTVEEEDFAASNTAPGIWDPFSDCSGTADASPRETDRGRQAQLTEALRLVRDMRREMGDMQTELLSQREQLRRERQPGPDAMLPDHQEATGDSESHT